MRLKSIYYSLFSLVAVFAIAACSDDDSKKLSNQFQLNSQEPISIHDIGLERDGRETVVNENFIHNVVVVSDDFTINSYGENYMDVNGEGDAFSFRITSSNANGFSDGIFTFTTEDSDMQTEPVFDEFEVYAYYDGDLRLLLMTEGQMTASENDGITEFHILGILYPADEFGEPDLAQDPIEFKASFKGEIPTYNPHPNL